MEYENATCSEGITLILPYSFDDPSMDRMDWDWWMSTVRNLQRPIDM